MRPAKPRKSTNLRGSADDNGAAPTGLALLLVLAAIGPAPAQEGIAGVASVIDGDTIEIHGQPIRLHGVDAPESSQLCVRPTGERWRCGQQASQVFRAVPTCIVELEHDVLFRFLRPALTYALIESV